MEIDEGSEERGREMAILAITGKGAYFDAARQLPGVGISLPSPPAQVWNKA